MKKEYTSPEWELIKIAFTDDQLTTSLESYSNHVDDDGDWGDPFGG